MWLHDYFQYHCQCLRNICPPDRTIASGEAGRVWLYLHDYFQYYDQRLRKVCSPDRTLATFQASTIGPYSHDLLECYDERLRKFCSSDTRLLTFDARAVQQHCACETSAGLVLWQKHYSKLFAACRCRIPMCHRTILTAIVKCFSDLVSSQKSCLLGLTAAGMLQSLSVNSE